MLRTCTLHVQRIACVCTQRFGYDYNVPIPVLWEPCNRKGSPFTLNSVSKLSPKKDLLKPAMCLKGYMYGGMSRIQPLLTYVSSFPNFSDPNPNFRYPNFSYLNFTYPNFSYPNGMHLCLSFCPCMGHDQVTYLLALVGAVPPISSQCATLC